MTTAETTTDTAPKAKKSVALSGVTAGNTALCTVGRTGNDLAYRGYDILDIAATCEFEEIAYLLVHGKLPNVAELAAYKTKLRSLRGLPEPVKEILERIPGRRASDGRDAYRRVGARHGAAGKGRPQRRRRARHRRPPAGVARVDAPLLVPLEPQRAPDRRRDRRRLDRRAFPPPAARREAARAVGAGDAHLAHPVRRARIQRVDVHRPRDRGHRRRHVLGAHRRHRRAARAEARRRQRGLVRDPEALRHAGRGRGRHPPPRRSEGSDHRLRASGVHDQRSAQRGDQGRRQGALRGRRQHADVRRSPSGWSA